MNTFNSLDQLNEIFYADRQMRKQYSEQASAMINKIKSQLPINGNKILSLSRSWLSIELESSGNNVKVLPTAIDPNERFSMILAVDELLTRESDEANQKRIISQLFSMLEPGGILLASLRDYKNTNCHRRPLGDSTFSLIGKDHYVITEVNELDINDKQRWYQKFHVVKNDIDFCCLEVGARRTLYFKQLAKYCADAGAPEFGMISDGYWRNHLRRTPEHMVYARVA